MTRIPITLCQTEQNDFVPLAVLGYALRRAGVLASLEAVELPLKTITHTPSEKLLEALVLILAGGRATSQADLLLRPNRGLAQGWGQAQFAQQSTLADSLDRLTPDGVGQMRQAFNTITGQHSASCRHDFRSGPLVIDGDLTGLPASPRADGSTKGFFSGKKTRLAANYHGSASASMVKPSAPGCMSEMPIRLRCFSRWSKRPKGCSSSKSTSAA